VNEIFVKALKPETVVNFGNDNTLGPLLFYHTKRIQSGTKGGGRIELKRSRGESERERERGRERERKRRGSCEIDHTR
jgi:hypothetical protein